MSDKDILQRFIFDGAPVRGEIVHLNDSFKSIMKQHNYPPMIQKILGEALVAASLLSAIIKFKGRLTVQFRGNGKLKLLLAQCNQQFQLRGLAQFDSDLKEDELWEALNQGVLGIMMDPDIPGGKRYQGIVAWKGQSFIETLEGYFYQSEQLPTRLWFSVNEECAAGMLLQVMPKDKPELYQNDWERLVMLTDTVKPEELLHIENQVLLHRLYSEDDVRVFEKIPVMFSCNCSVERSEHAIAILGQKEAEQELKLKENIVVTCEFCNKAYSFDRVDIARIFAKGDKPPSSTQIH
jgi:molecular chaperone Hsp33